MNTPFVSPIIYFTTKAPESVEFKKFLAFLKVTDNKDKLLKILQYICKLLVVGKFSLRLADMKSFAATLSLARKLGRLGNWVPAVEELYELSKEKRFSIDWSLRTISVLASFSNDLLDDWICLQRGRLLVKQPFLEKLDHWSTRLWFLNVSIDLHFALKKLMKAEKDKKSDASLAAAKLSCDWLFCFWEIADWSSFGGPAEYVPVFAGLSAACIGSVRGWRKLK
jgi:hypothetical protein